MSSAMWIVMLITVQRVLEVFLSHRNTKILLSEGFQEYYPRHYMIIVAFHVLWLAVLFYFANQNPPVNWVLFGLYIVLQCIRYYIIATLGKYWTTRILRKPGVPLVKKGLYKYIRHPNYVVVTLEIFLAPMIFGLVKVSLILGLAHLFIITVRVRFENRALRLS